MTEQNEKVLDDPTSNFKIRGIEEVKAVDFNRVCNCDEINEREDEDGAACSDCRYTPQLELTRPDRSSVVIDLTNRQVELIMEKFQVLDYPYKE